MTIGIALLPMTAGAVHDINVFELDGNALDEAALGDDWSTLFPTDTSSTDLGHSFTTDLTGSTDNGFGSGLTKDTADVPNWTSVVAGISPEKDDILHAYAATYVSGGEQILYFGQDRAPKPQGSTSMGFWFFQNAVSPPPSGTGNFTGTHANGDILVTSDMTNGGSVSVVNIFKWQNGSLVQVANLTNAECGPALTNDIACGKANEDGEITVPWSYPTATVPQNIFFEGGINLSELFQGQQIPCFSTFLANTRTSPSETADLKDYVVGSIDTCATITIHKDVVGGTSEQDFSYTTTGSGLSSFQLDDDGDNANTLKDTKVFTGLTPGNFSVSEGSLPNGWTNNDLVCTAEGPGTSVTPSGSDAGRTATITLGLAGNVECTFKNTFTKATPPVSTDIHAGAGASDTAGAAAITSAAIGSTVHDKATVGSAGGFGTPTGTVTFTVYSGNTTCTGGGTAGTPVPLSGGVAHPSGDATVPVGGLSYKAHYNGDSNYNGADGPCEPLTATKLNSSTVTDIHNASHQVVTSVAAGTTVHDKATVSGGLTTPTGDVTFKWFTNGTCTGDAAATSSAFALSGGSVDATSFAFTPNASGSFSFQATYAGNDTYNGSTGACEPLTVTKVDSSTATDIHNGAHQVVTSVPAGTTVHDKATVSGQAGLPTPTGTVTFKWFTNSACEGDAAQTSSAQSLSGGAVDATGFNFTPVLAGGYAFRATYSGDGTYNGSTGPCEPLTVTKVGSSTATDIHNAAHQVVLSVAAGTTVHDKATVSGQAGLPTPTGTVQFSWFLNGTCDGVANATSSQIALTGGAVDATAFNFTPVLAGSYSFQATYSGDGTYNGSTGPCEPLTVTKVGSSTATDIHNGAHQVVLSVPAGTTVHDKATVSGQAGLPTPTGTVTFKWFTNGTCDGAAASTSTAQALSGGSVDATGFAFTPNSSGSFAFQASYSGDDTYNGSTGPCEPLTVTKVPSTTVTDIHNADHQVVLNVPAGTTVHDKATVTGALATPTGTVTFKWFTNGTCDGAAAATSTAQALSGGSVDATGFNFTPNSSGSFAFQATYSGDATYEGSTGACEPLDVGKVGSSTATDIHNADHQVVLSVPAGTTVHDKATVTGQQGLPTPTGTVTFRWFTNGTCEGAAAATSTAQTLSGGSVDATGFAFTPGVSGSFAFRATYSGDGTYNGSTGPCEPLTVTKIGSSTATDIHNGAHQVVTTVPAGTTVHDKATVTGALSTPTGTVTFKWFTNGTCEGDAAATSTAQDLSGGSVDATGFAFTPVLAGGYSFQATYSGNDTYNGSTGPCEPLTVTKVNSSTATDIHNADHQVVLSVPAGTTVHDKATVTGQGGLPTPTGTVTFKWFTNGTCEGAAAATSTAQDLSGGSVDATGFAFTPGASGSFSFQATYSGDGTYNGSTGACEPLTVTKIPSTTVTDIHNGAHDIVTQVAAGTTVHDKATVTGALSTPTGTVTFKWFTNGTCEGDAAATSTAQDLSGGSVDATGFAFTPNASGNFSFQATYSGNATYNGSTGLCEPLEVGKLDSSTATDIHNGEHQVVTTVPAGTTVHDKATVTGQQGLPTPTGTVTFKWFLNGTCEGAAAATSDPVALSGGSADATAFTFTPTVSGSRSFQATYSGDSTYNSSTGACEPLEITKVSSSTATDVHSAAHAIITSAPLGSTVHDKATVTGQQGLPTPTGNVSFALYEGTACAGDPTAAGTVALDDGVAHPSDSAVVGLDGLSYKATYAGDGTYNGSTGPCEPLQVEKGTLTVIKDFVDSPEEATVTLRILDGESTLESGQRADGGSISKVLPPGTYTADEISGEGDVDLDLYTSSIMCVDGESTLVDEAGTSADVELANGADVTCTITNVHVKPQIAITKTPNPTTLQEPGGNVQFTLLVTNTSSIDPITITSLVDDKFGNLNADCGIPGAKWDLAPLAQATCTFTRNVQGTQSSPHKDTVTATGFDEGGNKAEASASATVNFTPQPPPPPSPIIDLAVTKTDAPDPAKLNGQITYTMVVKNNGPFTATQVTAADPLPEGTSFVSVSTTQGTCANNGGLIQCSIGTMPSGATVTITLVVTATRTGTLTNTVTVVGKEPESNTANNTATATTLVPPPLVPPKPKPPVVCYTFTVSSKTLTVGKKSTLVVTVKNKGKPVRGAKVVVTGKGIKKTGTTGKDGKARITITPKKAGIITIRVPQTLVCGARRIGVVGAFEPPVTG